MIKLDDLRLYDLLPPSIRDDKEISALAEAVEKELLAITACINEIVIMPRIDDLPEDIIDSLAWQLHVDFYEPLGLDLDKKRTLVKNSLSWHRRKGTKSVLVEIIRILFYDDFTVEEWYEYGGEPYYFRIFVNDIIDSRDKHRDLFRAIFELKNIRSWLEKLTTYRKEETTLYFGAVSKHRRRYTVGMTPLFNFDDTRVCTGCIVKYVRRYGWGECSCGTVEPELNTSTGSK